MEKDIDKSLAECRKLINLFGKNKSDNPFLVAEQWSDTMKEMSKEMDYLIELLER
jgi:hypothetical protein